VNHCVGWIARFEVWNVAVNSPQRLKDYRIPLDERELEDHLRSFLEATRSAEASTHSPDSQHQDAVPFPTAISHNLEFVIVLRTMYFPAQSSSSRSSTNDIHGTLCPRIAIPLELNMPSTSTLHSLKNIPGFIFPPSSSASGSGNSRRVPFSYAFKVSQNNRYLFCEDAIGSPNFDHQFKEIARITVFELEVFKGKNACRLLGRLSGCQADYAFRPHAHHSDQECFTVYGLHPSLPLIVFYRHSYGHPSAIALCCFTADGVSPKSCESLLMLHDLRATMTDPRASSRFSATAPGIYRNFAEDLDLTFSDRGTEVIVKLDGETHPKVISIECDRSYQQALALDETRIRAHRALRRHHESPDDATSPRGLALAQLAPLGYGQSIRSRGWDGTAFNEIVLSTNGSQRDLEFKHQSSKTEETQSLLSLPNWSGIENIHVSVRPPTTQQEEMTIILNKAQKTWCAPSTPADEHLPAIVRKDVRALGRVRKRNADGQIVESSAESQHLLAMLDYDAQEQDAVVRSAGTRNKKVARLSDAVPGTEIEAGSFVESPRLAQLGGSTHAADFSEAACPAETQWLADEE
jgi:hypothetical protein